MGEITYKLLFTNLHAREEPVLSVVEEEASEETVVNLFAREGPIVWNTAEGLPPNADCEILHSGIPDIPASGKSF